MRKTILIIFAALLPLIASAKGLTAQQVLDKAANRLKEVKTVTAVYDLTADGHTSTGTLAIAGEKFHLSSPDIVSWYDGNTQWTFSAASNEVNIIEPTPDELMQMNPFVIINSFRRLYTPVLLKAPQGQYKIKLTPVNKRNVQIAEAVLDLNASTLMPSSITLLSDSGHKIYIKIKSLKTGTNYAPSTFVFNKKQYPKAEIIDLR